MKHFSRHINAIRRLTFSPAGMTMLEHGIVTVLLMVAYAILLRRFGMETVGLWTLLTAFLSYAHVGDVWSRGLQSFVGEARGREKPEDAACVASTSILTGIFGYLL